VFGELFEGLLAFEAALFVAADALLMSADSGTGSWELRSMVISGKHSKSQAILKLFAS
jgi:hypothetical protein